MLYGQTRQSVSGDTTAPHGGDNQCGGFFIDMLGGAFMFWMEGGVGVLAHADECKRRGVDYGKLLYDDGVVDPGGLLLVGDIAIFGIAILLGWFRIDHFGCPVCDAVDDD